MKYKIYIILTTLICCLGTILELCFMDFLCDYTKGLSIYERISVVVPFAIIGLLVVVEVIRILTDKLAKKLSE